MRDAMDSVFDGMSANKAADLHGVPHSTLKDRSGGEVIHRDNPGLKPYLKTKEERELAGYLIEASNVGYGKTQVLLRATYVEKKEDVSLRRIMLQMVGGRSFWKGTFT